MSFLSWKKLLRRFINIDKIYFLSFPPVYSLFNDKTPFMITVEKLRPISFAFVTFLCCFSSCKKGEIYEAKFDFRNTGGNSLRIQSVNTSCGCTKISYSRTAIVNGEKGSIIVTSDSNAVNDSIVEKSILVEANTTPILHTLIIKGTVN